MKLEQLKKLIKEEVEAILDEADKASKAPPASFADFRLRVAAGLKKAKAPKDLCDEVADVDVEGGGISSALFGAWRNIELELKDAGTEETPMEAWNSCIGYYVHDAIRDVVDEYENAWNYGPGEKRGQKPINKDTLAKAVVAAMQPPAKKKTPADMKRAEIRDMFKMIHDILDGASDPSDPSAYAMVKLRDDIEGKKITYTVTRPDYLELIAPEANHMGFKQVNDTTWVDEITGLKVTFGKDAATIE